MKGGGDDGDRAEVRDLSDFTVYTTNGEVGRRWEILYRLINRCNDVIYYAPNAVGDKELLKRYANEAKELRGFGYYCLVSTFGEVPLITQPMQPAQILQIPRASLEKVYDKTIATGTNVPHFFSSRRVSDYQGYGFHVPSKDLYAAFSPDDPRITYVFTQSGDRYVGDTDAQDNTESQSGLP